MSQPLKLYRLQQVDSKLDKSLSRLSEIEEKLSNNQAIEEAEQQAQKIKTQLSIVQRNLKTAEANTQTQRNKIEQTEAQLFGGKVRNPKVLQDLQNESAALKRYLIVLEERQLEAMFKVDEVELEYESIKSEIDILKAQKIEQNAALNGEKSKLEKEIEKLITEKEAISLGIDVESLKIYKKLRDIRGGVAVALVSDKSCSACGSTLNSALLQTLRSPYKLTKCDTCGRVLYSG